MLKNNPQVFEEGQLPQSILQTLSFNIPETSVIENPPQEKAGVSVDSKKKTEMKESIVEAFTDGACRGNPGPGGWGVLLRYKEHEKQLYGGELDTTNNRMELMAAIMALESLTCSSHVRLTTDSQYVKKGITEWIDNWIKRDWKRSNKEPVKNVDLWQRLHAATQKHQVDWQWIKGHSGHSENEQADRLANQGIDSVLTQK